MSGTTHVRQQREMEEYLKRIKLKEIFQGLLRQVVVEQPKDPFGYFYEEVNKIKQEMEDNNIDIGSTTFLTTQYQELSNSKE
uniref:Uncharacterized protein n=1 Tax=Amphimedon queenslandica TaxID=400682 RepID=A0A1X7VS89_AMPQE